MSRARDTGLTLHRNVSFALLAALLFAGTAFAGCLSGKPSGPASPTATSSQPAPEKNSLLSNSTNDSARTNVTDDGTRSNDSMLGSMPHMHDYWHGKERVTLMDTDVTVDPTTGFQYTFYNLFVDREPAVGGVAIHLPDGATVYEGTGRLELTATWTTQTITGLAVQYRTAANSKLSDAKPLSSGAPLVVTVTPDMTDMPHMTTSKWAFLFTPPSAGGVIEGTFHLKVDIVKLRDITLFPGHPDLWQGKHQKDILDADETSTQNNFVTDIANFATGASGPGDDPGFAPKDVVPMETMGMLVNVHITSVTGTTGTVSSVNLFYHGADTGANGYRQATQVTGDPATGKFVYRLPSVQMKQTDSPYAKVSQWRFILQVGTDPTSGALGFDCGGCTGAQVSFHALVTVYDHPVLANMTSPGNY
ncbi:MAG: hypothetical protein ACYDCK_03105 [Thermoplasmatota archaeon]